MPARSRAGIRESALTQLATGSLIQAALKRPASKTPRSSVLMPGWSYRSQTTPRDASSSMYEALGFEKRSDIPWGDGYRNARREAVFGDSRKDLGRSGATIYQRGMAAACCDLTSRPAR
jgi:hypothetical protein